MNYLRLVVLGCLLGLAVQATHFRYSNIQWIQNAGTRSVTFTITSAWRRDFPDFRVGTKAAGDFVVGDTVTETATYFYPTTTSTSSANRFLFTMLVNSVNYGGTSFTNVAQNWFIGVQTVTYTYGSSLTAPTAYFQRCCRISTLKNNPDGNFRVETRLTVINGNTRRGLEVSMLPIVTMFRNVARTFPVSVIALPASDVTAVRYRLATGTEAAGSGNSYTQAVGSNGNALSVDFTSGVVSWTPDTIGAYSTQIVVEGYTTAPSSTSDKTNMITSHAIDFIVDVVNPSADNTAPTFTRFSSTSSVSGTTILTAASDGSYTTTIDLGATLTLNVTATDANSGDTVIVGTGAIPSGAVTTFRQANPGTLSMVWTPSASQLGSVVCFTAFDSRGLAAIANPCVTITIRSPDLFAEGLGLTYAVAGDWTRVFIHNAASRTHSLTISSGTSTASAVISTAWKTSWRNPQQVIYNATYNDPASSGSSVTKSGFYALTIQDTTAGQSGLLLYTLQVVPSITHAPSCDPFDLGSSGLTGGTALKSVFFFVQSQDRFQNDVTENRSPSGTNVETMEADVEFNSANTTVYGTYSQDGIWKITYTVPNNNAEAVYNLHIYLKSVSTGKRSLIKTVYPRIQPQEFLASLKTFTPYTAGQNIYFEITGVATTHRWTGSVNGVQIPAANITKPDAAPFTYKFSAAPLYVAKSYSNLEGIYATAPGLASEELTSSFEVVPADPYGPKCAVLSGTGDASAGDTNAVTIQLYDIYDNLITTSKPDTVVSYVLEHSVEGTRSGTADWVSSTFSYSFTYRYTTVGSLTVTLNVQAGSGAAQPIDRSPYTFNVDPADFSVSRSRTGYAGSFLAGESSSMVILARDAYNNERTDGSDQIVASFHLVGAESNYTYMATAEANSNRYSFSYTSTKAGTYEVAIQAYVPQEKDFVPFTIEKVIVTPGTVVPANTKITGDGWDTNSLSAGSSQQILSQAKDGFQNVVTEERDVLFVVKVTSGTTNTYFASSYVSPLGGSCISSSSSYVMQNLQTGTISAAEQLLAADGYHKLSYVVPSTNGRFSVEVSLCNSTNAEGLVNPQDVLATGCQVVGSQILTSNASAKSFSFADNYGAIAGTAIGGAVALGGLFYVGWRLHRYRPKYLAEKKRAEEAQKELEEIGKEVDIIPAHGDDEIAPAGEESEMLPPSKSGTIKGVPPSKLQVDEAPDVKMDISRPQIRKEFAPVRPSAKTDAGLAPPEVDSLAGIGGARSL